MDSKKNKSYHTLAAIIHLSTFSKYFIPLGNFIFPLIIWTTGKKNSLIDQHGKQALNFQLSIFFYMVLVASSAVAGVLITGLTSEVGSFSLPHDFHRLISIPAALPLLTILIIGSILLLGLFILELVCVIAATMNASDGKLYRYPLSIRFISTSPSEGIKEEPGNTATV